MAEYINRERARFEAKRYFKNIKEIQEDLDMLFCMLPAENVSSVRHGRWEPGNPICPVCGGDKFKDLDADIWCDWMPEFCPNCGAKMDGGVG